MTAPPLDAAPPAAVVGRDSGTDPLPMRQQRMTTAREPVWLAAMPPTATRAIPHRSAAVPGRGCDAASSGRAARVAPPP